MEPKNKVIWTTCCKVMAKYISYISYRVFFLTGAPLKVLSFRLHGKSHQKSSKCQNFLRVWHLVIFRADQCKKPPCIFLIRGVFVILISDIVLDKSACQRLQDMINRTRRIVQIIFLLCLNFVVAQV